MDAPERIWVTERPSIARMGACHIHKLTDATEYIRADLAAPDLMAELVEALRWYGEVGRLARLITREGDAGRAAISADGGQRAAAALAKIKGPQHG